MNRDSRILITGGELMIGSAITRHLKEKGYSNVAAPSVANVDLTEQSAVRRFFSDFKPEYVIVTSPRVGGIIANSKYPADFIFLNIQTQTNIIHTSWQSGVKKLLYLGSSCMYPKDCPQPMREEYLMTGQLEPTSEPYAIAKIAGTRMCQAYRTQYGADFIVAVPADVYGPDDDFNPETAHVLPALLARMQKSKTLAATTFTVWGSGTPRRELLYVDDLVDACLFLMDNYSQSSILNIGFGDDISIKDMAIALKETIGYRGDIIFDRSKPDGMPRKLLDTSRIINLGWKPRVNPSIGINMLYDWYRIHHRGKKEI